jgi:hypothetical protein
VAVKRSPDAAAFAALGLRRSECFAHEVARIEKPYPDTYLQLERRGLSPAEAASGRCRQLNLYALDLEGLPDALFTDRAVNWHQQQLGRAGLIAAAGLFQRGDALYVTLLQSDLCQQLSKHAALKAACRSRVANRFRRWYALLLNAVLDQARDDGLPTVYTPTAAQIRVGMRAAVDPTLFERIYDSAAARYLCQRVRVGAAEYWKISLAANADRVVPLRPVARPRSEPAAGAAARGARPVIALFHDVEEDVDTDVSPETCRAAMARALVLQESRGIRVTYSLLGTLFAAARPLIAGRGHALAFHSHDHHIAALDQLPRLRRVDWQVRGYRPPRSILTAELTDHALAYWNFEWLLCSARRLGFADLRLVNGLVKIPVHLDDYRLHTGDLDRTAWLGQLRRLLATQPFVCLGLHDCYARHWLDWYGDLLDELAATGDLRTCDELADQTFMASDADPEAAAS